MSTLLLRFATSALGLAGFMLLIPGAAAQSQPSLTLRNLGVSFAPRADAGSGWGVDSVNTGQSYSDVVTGSTPTGAEMRFMLGRTARGFTCSAVMQRASRGDNSRRHTRTHFLPIAGWVGEAVLTEGGIYLVCSDGAEGALFATVQGITGRPEEGKAVRGVLEPLAAAMLARSLAALAAAPSSPPAAAPAVVAADTTRERAVAADASTSASGSASPVGASPAVAGAAAPAAAPAPIPTIHVNLSRNRGGFTIPAGAWNWRAMSADIGGNPGAVLSGLGADGQKLEIGIRALPSAGVPGTGCLDLTFKLGPVPRATPRWVPAGFSQYASYSPPGRGTACLVRPGTYFLVAVSGNLDDPLVTSEVTRVLGLFRDSAR